MNWELIPEDVLKSLSAPMSVLSYVRGVRKERAAYNIENDLVPFQYPVGDFKQDSFAQTQTPDVFNRIGPPTSFAPPLSTCPSGKQRESPNMSNTSTSIDEVSHLRER